MEDLFFAMTLAQQNLFNYQDEITPMTGMCLVAGHILDQWRQLQSFSKWDKGVGNNPVDETLRPTQLRRGVSEIYG